ncbi:unnamed protein product [Caenorhabditis auriculariae]|uniref:Uncharacterized protein n=1 Tax=Caenorhabditis auriculariae TaxID=2777116 RepID=A0A8S1HXY8_9PELO|nr:unnamed protein product [Caenorhabditis auriculariae]
MAAPFSAQLSLYGGATLLQKYRLAGNNLAHWQACIMPNFVLLLLFDFLILTQACLQTVPSSTTSLPVSTVTSFLIISFKVPTDSTTSPTSTTSSSSTSTSSSSSSTTSSPSTSSSTSTTTTPPMEPQCSTMTLTKPPDTTMDEVPATFMFNGAMVVGDCPLPTPDCMASISVYIQDGRSFTTDTVPFTFTCVDGQIEFNQLVSVGIFCVIFC